MKGTAWKFGNDIDTDIIIPGRYLIYTDEETLAKHSMELRQEPQGTSDFRRRSQGPCRLGTGESGLVLG